MIKNTRESVYGVVKENEQRLKFSGLETETAKVSVDNENKTISVDVLTENLIGTDAGKAYPGYRGLLQEEILRAEIERAKASENDILSKSDAADEKIQSKVDEHIAASSEEISSLKKSIEDTDSKIQELSESVDDVAQSVFDANSQDYYTKTEIDNTFSSVQSDISNTYTTKNEMSDAIEASANTLSETFEKALSGKSDTGHTHEISSLKGYDEIIVKIPDEYVKEDELTSVLADYTKTADLSSYATKSELSGYALKGDLKGYVTNSALEDRIGAIDFSSLVKDDELISSIKSKLSFIGGCTAQDIQTT